MQNQITSVHNDRVKFLNQLKEKSKVRKKEKLFIIEGKREISLAIQGGYNISQLYYCTSIISYEEVLALIDLSQTTITLFEITQNIYEKLAYRTTTEGVLAIAIAKETDIHNFTLPSKNPLILVPDVPEVSQLPLEPLVPSAPLEPELPSDPLVPDEPLEPEEPLEPLEPLLPEEPEQPKEPDEPDDTEQQEQPLVPEAPEKPGNIGALIRTADAAQLDAV